MKVVAVCECSKFEESKFEVWGYDREEFIGELKEGAEYQVTKVEIGKSRSKVWVKLPDQSEKRIIGSCFRFELVLDSHPGRDERRVPFDIPDDLLQERNLYSRERYHHWEYNDDMPSVTTTYTVL